MSRKSFWKESGQTSFVALEGSKDAGVVVIGGGITGLTTAYLLAEKGIRVVLLEAFRIGDGTTGHSSCHLTTDIDAEYRNIHADFDKEVARLVADSRVAAINFIERISSEKNINCDFKRVPGYLYTEIPEHVVDIEQEARYARRAGLDVSVTTDVPLPFEVEKAVKFGQQAQFNSQKYLNGFAEYIMNNTSSRIFENSLVTEVEEKNDYIIVRTAQGQVRCEKVVMATHLPLFVNVLQTMAAPYISYIITARLKNDFSADALFWDTSEPYHYLRFDRDEKGPLLIAGGSDHKTGHGKDTRKKFDFLERYVKNHFDVLSIEHRWSAQYYEPADGLPYIGKNLFSSNTYVATGFSGDGLVYGTVAAMLISDMIQEKDNPWLKAYDAGRFKPAASAYDFVKENADVVKHFVKDRITDTGSPSELLPGEGKIFKINGKKTAVARDMQDNLHAVSPVCTHMKCIVRWNSAEMSWDCPCHGSRFGIDGEVLYGPAVKGLKEKKEIELKAEKKKNVKD